jgi:hypothetical protein
MERLLRTNNDFDICPATQANKRVELRVACSFFPTLDVSVFEKYTGNPEMGLLKFDDVAHSIATLFYCH